MGAGQGFLNTLFNLGKKEAEAGISAAGKETAESVAEKLSKSDLVKDARKAARAEYKDQKPSLLGKSYATKGDLRQAAYDAIKDNGEKLGLRSGQVKLIAAKAADRAENGGLLYKYSANMITKHPYATVVGGTTAVTAAAGAAGAYSLYEKFNSVMNGDFSALTNGTTNAPPAGGVPVLGSVFNFASEQLQYMGMDAKWANIILGFGSFMAVKSALDVGLEMSGLDKKPIIGSVLSIGILVGSAILAFQMANGENSAQPSKLQLTDTTIPPSPEQQRPAYSMGGPT